MNFKSALIYGLFLAGCSAQYMVKPVATRPDSNAPTSGGDLSQQAEGTITSSGGFLYGLETNPWFLQNTESVDYCIDLDETNFGVSKDEAQRAIKFAISTWKDKLETANYSRYAAEDLKPWREIRLGTQTFNEVPCDHMHVSLRFQLGKLSKTQQIQVGNPSRFVAKTFETSYDEINLRGEGFIYLAPESGPLGPAETDVGEHFWGVLNNAVLKSVLIHEMGHVFGLSHQPNTLMAEDMPQRFLNKDFIDELTESLHGNPDEFDRYLARNISHVFGASEYTLGVVHQKKELFGSDTNVNYAVHCALPMEDLSRWGCGLYEFVEKGPVDYVLGKQVGRLDSSETNVDNSGVIKVKLPRNQRVFEVSDRLAKESIYSPYLTLNSAQSANFEISGSYISNDGKVKMPMMVTSKPDFPQFLRVLVISDGKFVSVSY